MRKSMAALTALLFVGVAVPTTAEPLGDSYQEAFARRVSTPGNTSALSDFVRAAVIAGQYDQALSTIEEHLINYPLDPKAHLIAARLYNHVGSRELAARHLEIALEIGTLEPDDEVAAKRLLGSVNNALNSAFGQLDITVGIRSETYDFSPTAPWADRSDTNAFLVASGLFRFDLETSNNAAIILFGEAGTRRRFGDFNFDGFGGVYTAPHGRGGVTLDVGLPTELIPTLRGQATAFVSYERFDSGLYRQAVGGSVRLTSAPTANTFAYIEGSYAWLGDSHRFLLEDDRYGFEAGLTWRVYNSHTVGLAGRGYEDRRRGIGKVGDFYEIELSYAGQVWAFDNGPIWTQGAGIALADVQIPNIVLGPAFPYFGDYWRVYWNHRLQIDDLSRFELDLAYRETNYDNLPIRNQSKFDFSLSYTISLY